MSDPSFGISITTLDNEQRPAIAAVLSIIGLVGTAPGADASLYPINDPVRIFSDDAVAVTKLGLTGTLAGQIALINAQLGEFQVAAQIVIVRVTEGANAAETITNVIGNAALKTGMHALRLAGHKLGVVPRLIGFPGVTQSQPSGIAFGAITTPGAGGANGTYALAFIGGTGSGATGTFTVAGGALTAVTITNKGVYTAAPTLSFVASTNLVGAAATLVLDKLANPVIAEANALLAALNAHAVATGPHSTLDAFTDWVETISSRRIIPVETWAKAGVSATDIDSVGTVLGIAVRRDHEKGGVPSGSWANQPVYGIVGPNRYIDFDITNGDNEGQQILALRGGIIIRGEAGVESAIASGGFVFVGTDTASEDPLWQFYNVSRTRDYIHLTFLKTLRFYLGRYTISGQVIEAILGVMDTFLRDMTADGHILGYKTGFRRDENNAANLRLGRFNVTFAAEEAPVLRQLGISSARYAPALDDLLENLLSQFEIAL